MLKFIRRCFRALGFVADVFGNPEECKKFLAG